MNLIASNMSHSREGYVEVQLNKAHLHDPNGKGVIGWSISTQVFSPDSMYDDLIDYHAVFKDQEAARQCFLKLKADYDLCQLGAMEHRQQLWSV